MGGGVNVRAQAVRQPRLHLERGAQSPLRGPDRHAVASAEPQGVLREGGGKARRRGGATARGGCFDGMEEDRR